MLFCRLKRSLLFADIHVSIYYTTTVRTALLVRGTIRQAAPPAGSGLSRHTKYIIFNSNLQ
jgi:hypothetical protein